jgi:tRNA threonylcarbamoyl adenosine modification protein YeaZ
MLVIEAAIGGGSIALFDGSDEIGCVVGPKSVSRAEDLLPNIDSLLAANHIEKSSLSCIVVGAGPGSFTGIRIGIATALGLSAALEVPVRHLSTLAAIAATADVENELTVGIAVGRETICVQSFSRRHGIYAAASEPEAVTHDKLREAIETGSERSFIASSSICEALSSVYYANLFNAGKNLAGVIGRAAIRTDLADVASPLFIGKQK